MFTIKKGQELLSIKREVLISEIPCNLIYRNLLMLENEEDFYFLNFGLLIDTVVSGSFVFIFKK